MFTWPVKAITGRGFLKAGKVVIFMIQDSKSEETESLVGWVPKGPRRDISRRTVGQRMLPLKYLDVLCGFAIAFWTILVLLQEWL